MKIVLVGGPCTGKTTTIKELERLGHNVIHEAAREIIAEELLKNSDFKTKDNILEFQNKVLERQINNERIIKKEELFFLDHGIPSGIAFFEANGVSCPQRLIDASKECRYDKVLILEMLSKYENDNERMEPKENAEKIHLLLRKIYEGLGYEVVSIPEASVEERIRTILSISKNL